EQLRKYELSTTQVRPKDEPNMLISTIREVGNKLAAIEQLRILFNTARSLLAALYDSGSISCCDLLTYIPLDNRPRSKRLACTTASSRVAVLRASRNRYSRLPCLLLTMDYLIAGKCSAKFTNN